MTNNKKQIDGMLTRRTKVVLRDVNEKHAKTPSEKMEMPSRKNLDPFAELEHIKDLGQAEEVHREPKPSTKKVRVKKPKRLWKKILAFTLIPAGAFTLVVIGFTVAKFLQTSSAVFEGSIVEAFFSKEKLAVDENGRTNVLIFGTEGFDSSGSGHPGSQLTDSIMVLSVDQDKNNAFMVSLPRDLYVEHECKGVIGTSAGKLNETYYCIFGKDNDETAAANELQKTAGKILGLDVQYYVHINFKVLVDLVDTIGGIDLTFDKAIYDPNFDWTCKNKCNYVKYSAGETAHLDGIHALYLARSRGAAGGYGIGTDFERGANQQKILVAIQKKIIEDKALLNVSSAFTMLDSLGDNLKTNFKTKEIRTLIDLAQNFDSGNIKQIILANEAERLYLVKTTNINGASCVIPSGVSGMYDYTKIKNYIADEITKLSSSVKEEVAEDAVEDATPTP
ncbi:MAG: LCP family protein [Candidatus Nomurabacteria bacterium]|jgi:LCP family protein required for cell wall assembly|nr:LCP family protein [Candidatus Nomurabacteria bacterium]